MAAVGTIDRMPEPLSAEDYGGVDAKSLANYDPMAEIGVSGLVRHGWTRAVIESEWAVPELRTLRQRVVAFRDMRNSEPIAAAALRAIELMMQRTKWRIEPADNKPKAREVGEFVEAALFEDMNRTWEETLSGILSMLWVGFSLLETTFKVRRGDHVSPRKSSLFKDRKIGWASWRITAPETVQGWEYDPRSNDLIGVRQLAAPHWREELIPMAKMLHFTTVNDLENPEGVSVLRAAWPAHYYAKRLRQLEGLGAERDLAGLPMMKAPAEIFSADATDPQKALYRRLRDMVEGVRQGTRAGILMPQAYDRNGNPLYEFSLLSAGGSRQFPIESIVQRYEAHIARVLLADFLLLGGQGASGSFALSTDKTSLWQASLDAVTANIRSVINRNAIPKLCRLNRIDQDLWPHLDVSPVRRADVSKISGFLKDLTATGLPLWPDNELEDYLREAAELPAVTEDVRREREAAAQQAQMGADDQAQDDDATGNGKAAEAGTQGMDQRIEDKPTAQPPIPQGAPPPIREGSPDDVGIRDGAR